MKILVVTNLYPPHHAGTYDFRCQSIVKGLMSRGHDIRVLTSNHGIRSEQRDDEIERRLLLNGAHGYPPVTRFSELKELEIHNHTALCEMAEAFGPELIYVWSLHGLSKSLIFTMHKLYLPIVYDVADYWISQELGQDPWLSWWNRPKLPFGENMMRSSLELAGQREKIDDLAPTRDRKDIKRLSHIYDSETDLTGHEPNAIATFRFDRAYFCSRSLKDNAVQAGYHVSNAAVIHPGIATNHYQSSVKPADASATRILICSRLHQNSGIMTALKALVKVRAQNNLTTLSIYGRGESDYIAQLRSFVVRAELPVVFNVVADPVKEMPAVYRQHDIFLHTSEWADPYSATQMEAMAAGLPVISTGYAGAGEILRHAENSLLYEPGNDEELAQRIMALQSQGELRHRLATTGQSDVLANFDDAMVLHRIDNYLADALQKSPVAE